jgi:small subunit ribosomal protein S20
VLSPAVKTAVKKVRVAVESGDKEVAAKALLAATAAIDKAESKGIYQKSYCIQKSFPSGSGC